MAKKERNRGSVDRARAKRGTTPSSERSREYMDEVPARPSELAPTSTRDKPVPRPMRTAPAMDSMGPSVSMRPMTNPRRSDAVDRGNENIRFEQSEQNDVLRGKRFAEGGEVRGCKGVQMSGKGFSGSY